MLGRVIASTLALTSAAFAQTPDGRESSATTASGRVSYDSGFFAQFSPQTALDVVRQTPGFTLDDGDERRGFSGAVGNVLIDGLRPTVKTQTLESFLARIPAAQVLRVEVLRGGEVAGDASGQAVLLNIVRTPSASGGVYDVQLAYSGQHQDRITSNIEASYSGRVGQIEWGVGVHLESFNRGWLAERRYFDGADAYDGRARYQQNGEYWDPAFIGNVAFPLWGGRFSASGMIYTDWFREREFQYQFFDAANAAAGALDTHWHEEGTLPEIGLNYDRDIGPWALALVALRSQDPRQYHEEAVSTDALGAVEEIIIQDIEYENVETILRGTFSRTLNPNHRIEFGGEGALNTLDSALALTVDEGGGPIAQPIPNSNIVVEEERAEFFGVHTWNPRESWSLETRVAWESSTLTFTGDANNSTELAFWKPSLQLTHTFSGENQARVRLYRDVGQLDFNDFASAASLTDDRIDGGNPDLRPQSDWRLEFGADLRFPGGAALGVTLTHHDITDVNDLIPLTATMPNPDEDPGVPGDETIEIIFDAPGNLDEAEAWSLNLNFASPLPLIPNARLTLDAEFWDTEVIDPVTGAARIISGQPESSVEISFRQDFPDMHWSWGLDVAKEGEIQGYYLSEIDTTD